MTRVALDARSWKIAVGPEGDESLSVREAVAVEIDMAKTALIVIDAWERHPVGGHNARLARNLANLLALLALFRGAGRPILHDPTGLPMHPAVLEGWSAHDRLIEWDPMGGGTQLAGDLLKAQGIESIFWGGYDANLCVMAKPLGFRKMRALDWDRYVFLVRDATIAFESSQTLASEALWDAACYEVEYDPKGFTCTVADLARAFASALAPA